MIKAIELNMMAKTIENSLIVTLIKSSNTGKQFNFKRPRSFFQLLFQFSICKGKEFLCHSLLKKDPTLTQLRPLTRIFYVTNYPDIRGHGWKWQDVLKREIQIVPAEYHLIPSCFRFFFIIAAHSQPVWHSIIFGRLVICCISISSNFLWNQDQY